MRKRILINTTADGLAFALTTRMPLQAGLTNLTGGGGHYPATGVMEIYEEEDADKRNE